MQTFDLANIGILGTFLTIVVTWLKAKWGIDSTKTKITVVVIAAAFGAFYVLFSTAPWWGTFIGIVLVSQAVYAFFIK